jgi:hypothetical protein
MQFLASEFNLRVCEVPVTIKYLDKPKRSVISQGLTVLSGILGLVGQHRPLLYFGLPGVCLQMLGLLYGTAVVQIYHATQTLAVGYTVLSGLLLTLGTMTFFTGLILHSMRGLLLSMLRGKDRQN